MNAVLLVGVSALGVHHSRSCWRDRLALGRPRAGAGLIAVMVVGTAALSQALDSAVVLAGFEHYGFLSRFARSPPIPPRPGW